jgi:hypothetical protein
MESSERANDGRFRAEYDLEALVEMARSVVAEARLQGVFHAGSARRSRPHDADLSQADFDRIARELYGDRLPSGRVIARRLGASWRAFIRVAAAARPKSASSSLGRRARGGAEKRRFSVSEITIALRAVQVRLGRVPSSADYDEERRQMLRQSRRAYLTGQLTPGSLPTSNQIMRQQNSNWQGALELAGLVPPTPPAPGLTPASGADARWVRRGVPKVVLLEAILEQTGLLPGAHALPAVAHRANLAVGGKGCRYAQAVAELRQRREALGLPMPSKPSSDLNDPAFQLSLADIARLRADIASRLGVPEETLFRAKHHRWTETDAVHALREFLRAIEGGGHHPSIRLYRAMKGDHPEWPPASRLAPYGGYKAVLQRARKLEEKERDARSR